MNDLLSTGELAHLSGVPASTLRLWTDAGLLPAPLRIGQRGMRAYPPRALTRARQLQQARGGYLPPLPGHPPSD